MCPLQVENEENVLVCPLQVENEENVLVCPLQVENEENVLVCLRIIIELHKQFRPSLSPEVRGSSSGCGLKESVRGGEVGGVEEVGGALR